MCPTAPGSDSTFAFPPSFLTAAPPALLFPSLPPTFRFRRSRLLSTAVNSEAVGGGREGGGVEELGFSGALAAAPLPGEC